MENSEIIWTGSPDDQAARIGDYVLRVEKMDKEWYWGRVSLKNGQQIGVCGGPELEEAKAAAINAMNEHLKKK